MHLLFAHNGVEHADKAESATHLLPQILGVSLITLVVILFVVHVLSTPATKIKKKDEDEA